MNNREHLATLAARLALEAKEQQSPVKTARDALALVRIGRSAATLATRYCNGEGHWEGGRWVWTEEDDKRCDRRRDAMHKKAQAIADDYGARVELGGDPRGYVLKLHFGDAKGEGFGVA